MNSVTPVTRRRRKKRGGKTAVMVILSVFFVLASVGCIFGFLLYFHQKQETAQAMLRMGEMEKLQEALFTQEQLEEHGIREREALLQEMQKMVEEGATTLTVLQHFFPDQVVVSGDGKYHFFPILDHLAKHEFREENFVYPVKNEASGDYEGELTYQLPDGSYARKGIDVSRFQGEIDWRRVAGDGIEYAFIRLGYRGYESGKIVLDSEYEYNIEGSLDAGIDTGVYFFTEALTEREAEEEAEFVIENLRGYDITMPVVIDVEESSNPTKTRTKELTQEQRTKNVIAFCERIREAGYQPMIYGNLKSFMLMMDIEQLEAYDKWFAYYRYPFHFPYKIRFWQHTASGRVSGIPGDVDLNLMFY